MREKRWQKRHHEDRRENAEDERKDHLDRRLHRLRPRPLAADISHIVSLDRQRIRHGSAETLRLRDGHNEEVYILRITALRHELHRAATGHPHAYITEHTGKLIDQGPLHALDDLAKRRIERKPCLHRDREKIQHIRQLPRDERLAFLDDMIQDAEGKQRPP